MQLKLGVLVLCLIVSTSAQGQSPSERMVKLFLGKWVGTVTYRQEAQPGKPAGPPSTRKLLTKPMWASITQGKKPGSIAVARIYDENKSYETVQNIWTFSVERKEMVDVSEGELKLSYGIESDINKFLSQGSGELIMMTHSKLGGEPYDSRVIFTLTRNLMIREREVKQLDGTFAVEQQMVLTREQP